MENFPYNKIVNLHSHAPRNVTNQEHKVCDVCHERPATHHTCYAHTGESSHLCVPCYEQIASSTELEYYRHSEQVIRNGKCKYCGGPAIGGCTGLSIPGVLEERADLWCEPCRLDLVEFASRPENAMPEDFDVGNEVKLEQISQQLVERESSQQEFMRQRVKERSR